MKGGVTYEVLAPHIVDPLLYESNHEAAYEKATEVFYPFMEESDVVFVYAPNGLGEHTTRDLDHAKSKKIPYTIYPDDAKNARIYEGYGLDLSVLRFDFSLSELQREVDFLHGQVKDHERLKLGMERDMRRQHTLLKKIDNERLSWKKLKRADLCMKEIDELLKRVNL
jgi:hypothetical protein